jgi:beta-glucanase (GH16 family)
MKTQKRFVITMSILFSCCISFAQYSGYTLLWSDEFEGGYANADAETGLDMSAWSFETGNGNGGWGTGQRDWATSDIENVEVSNGTLKIRTQRNHANQTNEYTSGRILTKDKKFFTYGKIEAKIRTVNMTESGRGFAFWMMPNGLYNGTTSLMWPQGGEVDIFEYNGLYPQYNLGSVHHAWKWNNNQWGGDGNHAHSGSIYNPLDRSTQYRNVGRNCGGEEMTQNKNNLLGAEWHIYGINWFDDRIEFYVDNDIYHVFYNNWESWCGNNEINNLGNHYNKAGFDFDKVEDGESHNSKWRPFQNPFYIILSAGVGGNNTYGGNITNGNNPQTWTCTTEIDWVRVYNEGEGEEEEEEEEVGIKEIVESGKIQVYADNFELKILNYELKNNDAVKILDITGKLIHNLPLITKNSFNISVLPQGIYLLQINNQVVKFIKK